MILFYEYSRMVPRKFSLFLGLWLGSIETLVRWKVNFDEDIWKCYLITKRNTVILSPTQNYTIRRANYAYHRAKCALYQTNRSCG